MFSFHKPRVYRSAEGCCICRAKSSSSRFTDSRKYEQDSMKCFDLKYPRHGEICNACVLLVKRFKRLPMGSNRHWGHVVDARAGPGTKSISKHKKSRDDTENTTHNTSSNSTNPSRRIQNTKSLIPEKFTKIFKKSKKNKVIPGQHTNNEHKVNVSKGRDVTPQAWPQQHFTTHDLIDSDYEDLEDAAKSGVGRCEGLGDVRRTNNTNSSSSVKFQTQTRASSYRAASHKNNTAICTTQNFVHSGRKHIFKTGSKRRKLMLPVRNRPTLELLNNNNVQFFDELEWRERKSCCGQIFVCSSLVGTILVDMEQLKVCAEHNRKNVVQTKKENLVTIQQEQQQPPLSTQKTIIATLPTVVQISAPSVGAATAAIASTSVYTPLLSQPIVSVVNTNSTPVLKKHHLFFKRQSECFPQLDLANLNNSSNKTENVQTALASAIITDNTTPPLIIKNKNVQNIKNNNNNNKCTITPTSLPNHTTAILNGNNSPITNIAATLPLAINTTANISAISTISPPSCTNATSVNAQFSQNSAAKVTTISPSLPTTSTAAANLLGNSNRLLHKIKTGKILKHSLDKIGVISAVGGGGGASTASQATIERIKTGDLPEVKPIVRGGVSKSYVITKPTNTSVINQQNMPQYYTPGSSPTSTCSNSSVISSASSSAAPKFSDNSSDSGFDENLQDRKSASPLQEDTEKKLATRTATGNVHTMFLASGVQIQGQHQNLMLTGNEIAAKLLQNRKQQMSMLAAAAAASNSSNGVLHQHYQQQPANNFSPSRIGTATSSLKISQITPTTISTMQIGSQNNSGSSNSNILGSHYVKGTTPATTQSAHTMYNNNTIQHENGVTTIVPASSLAASSQTAAMNAHAPSSVTITPAPTHNLSVTGGSTNISNTSAAISLSKKLTTSFGVNLITTGSNNHQSSILQSTHLINHNPQQQHHNHPQQNHQLHHHNTTNNLNQKIILLKTTTGPTKFNNLGNINNVNSNANNNNIKMTSATITGAGAANISATSTVNAAGVCKN